VPRFTAEQRERVAALRAEGRTIHDAAEEMGCASHVIAYHFGVEGWARKTNKTRLSDAEIEQLTKLRDEGKSCHEAAVITGHAYSRIWRYVRGWKRPESTMAWENRGKAIALREQGLSSGLIADELGVSKQRVFQYLEQDAPELLDRKATVTKQIGPLKYLVGTVVGRGCEIVERHPTHAVLLCRCGSRFKKSISSLSATEWTGVCRDCHFAEMRKCDYSQIVKDYLAGLTWQEISQRHGITKAIVGRAIDEAGVLGKRKKGATWHDQGRTNHCVNHPA
jgi:predicted transcriptional regulator/transposase-like protein